jgi:hypothetical protein
MPPHSAPHDKQQQAALDNPEVQRLLNELHGSLNELPRLEAAKRINTLRETMKCSLRGIARGIGKDDGTVRNYLKLLDLPACKQEEIAAGASPTAALRDSWLPQLQVQSAQRREREQQSGGASDDLADKLAWFMMRALPRLCVQPYLDQVFWWAERGVWERTKPMLRDPYARKLPEPVSPSYPLGHIIRMSQPDEKLREELIELTYAQEWLEDVALRLETNRLIRADGFTKAERMLRKVALDTAITEAKKKAAHSTPKEFGEYLRSLDPPAGLPEYLYS